MRDGPAIGLALIEVARARGAHVVATDVIESRLEVARQLGAETMRADDKTLGKVMEQTNGEGAFAFGGYWYVVNAAGSAA